MNEARGTSPPPPHVGPPYPTTLRSGPLAMLKGDSRGARRRTTRPQGEGCLRNNGAKQTAMLGARWGGHGARLGLATGHDVSCPYTQRSSPANLTGLAV